MTNTAFDTGAIVLGILLPVGFGVIMIVSSIHQARTRRERVLGMRNLATRLSFDDFNPNRDYQFATGWGFLSRLAQGQDRYALNMLRGTYHGQALLVYDYHYQTGSGKNRQEHNCTMLMLVFKEAFPKLTIGPENLGLKIAEAFGMANDIKFESAEFSRNYCVRSPDKKFAYDVCNPQMIDYLLTNPGLQIEIQGPVISLAFEPLLPVEQIEFNLQLLIEIRARLPEYLFTST